MKAIYGRKVGMTHVFIESGEIVPVTVLELGPNVVHQVKTQEADGYQALQVGFGQQKPQRVNKALTGHYAKAKKGVPKFVGELRADAEGEAQFQVGDAITLEGMFEAGNIVDVVGTSIGKGFAGVMKRHHMKGAQTKTHGTHENFRHAGSIGCRKFPGRVFKGRRMAGHMGAERVVQQGLEVVQVRPAENLLLVKGSVPGPRNGRLLVREARKVH